MDRLAPGVSLGALVAGWVGGWTFSRGFAVRRTSDGFEVAVDLPERTREFVALWQCGDEAPLMRTADAARHAEGQNWVTVITDDPATAARSLREEGLRVDGDTEWFMTIDLADQEAAELPRPYRLGMSEPGPVREQPSAARTGSQAVVLAATVVDRDGEIAATGRIAVRGGIAVPDRIMTGTTHRRRGLGAAVMHALVDAARGRGATTGVLAASLDGERLYRRLGWTPAARIVVGRT